MPSWFVRPDTVTLHVSDGHTLTIRRRLNHGETTAAYTRMYLAGVDGALKVNPLQTGMAMVTAYLVDWSVTDDAGNRVAIADKSVEALTTILNNLAPEKFAEIKDAIEQHEARIVAEREQEKKVLDGKHEPAILPSPSVVAGPSIESVN